MGRVLSSLARQTSRTSVLKGRTLVGAPGDELIEIVGGALAAQDREVAQRGPAAHLALKGLGDERGTARSDPGGDGLVEEGDDVVGQPHGDLGAHELRITPCIPKWDS